MYELLKEKEKPASYFDYHQASIAIGDVDPSYQMLRYVCDRFELNMEQRYWLAFLYATCYCGPTVFYIYNEFPDFENVDVDRLERWWKANKQRCYFQTDRRRVKTGDHFCNIFRSYKEKIGRTTQERRFKMFKSPFGNFHTYDVAWDEMSDVYQFGRFSMFLYLEAVHVVTGFAMEPRSMEINEAESCRNGLAFAIGREDLISDNLKKTDETYLQQRFDSLVGELRDKSNLNTVWNIETTLCAYKKYCLGSRYVGYYLDRQHDEIRSMEAAGCNGVDWSVLWDYRRETYEKKYLKELK